MDKEAGDKEQTTGCSAMMTFLFEGEPHFTCDLTLGTRDDFADQGMLGPTMRVVNAIPYVCEAPPGLVTSLEPPARLPRGAFAKAKG